MKVSFTASPETVQAVVDQGFGALPSGSKVALKEVVPGAFDDLGGQAAALVEAPQDVLEVCEQPAGMNGQPRTFLVPSELAESFPLIAYRGTAPPKRGGGRPAGRRSRDRVLSAVASLVLAGVLAAAFVASLGGDEGSERPVSKPAPKSPPISANATNPAPDRTTAAKGGAAKRSRALGSPTAGRLVNGVALPAEGEHFFTWNIPRAKSPNERFRRFGTAAVVERVRDVISAYARAHPQAPRVGVADLSLPKGGEFGVEFGGSGHVSHQNGLEVDILYPRGDGEERAVTAAAEVDRALAQDLLDRFVDAGAAVISVDPALGLRGEPSVVRPEAFHEEHMHVRFPAGVAPG